MSKRKEIVDSVKPIEKKPAEKITDLVTRGDLARCSHEGKIEHRAMLLSTSYGLNSSYTKRIHVGLQTSNSDEFDFQPVVKLAGRGNEGVFFDLTWEQFQANMWRMSDYLDGSNSKPDPIIIDKIVINFTTAYGVRALLVAYRETEKKDAVLENPAEENANTPKKRKIYSVAIVMQKATFLGLENIIDCVNANLLQLNVITSSANDCAKYLVNEIQINLPVKGYIESDIIKLTLKANRSDIQHNARLQLKDLTFLDTYFEKTFLELIALYFDQIVNVIKMQRNL